MTKTEMPNAPYTEDGKYDYNEGFFNIGVEWARKYRSFREGFIAGHPKVSREMLSETVILGVFMESMRVHHG